MKRPVGFALIAYCVLVVAGTATLTYWDGLDRTGRVNGRPEGYSRPESAQTQASQPTGPVRVMHLKMADNVYTYLDRSLEVVAMTPGSGWMRFKTDDGISPLLSFDRISGRDIRQFNAFAESLDKPIRVRLVGDRLEVFALETVADTPYVADGETETPRRKIAFFRPRVPKPELVMRRDANGRIFLVDAKSKKRPQETVAANR